MYRMSLAVMRLEGLTPILEPHSYQTIPVSPLAPRSIQMSPWPRSKPQRLKVSDLKAWMHDRAKHKQEDCKTSI